LGCGDLKGCRREAANCSSAHCCYHGAQVESIQEGPLDVPLEVEEEAHAPPAKEVPED